MVPVGRLTLVRSFARSELIRAMSFVAIPALIGPMLGPLTGGFIVGFFHWRVIFFVNIPIGLLGLYLVHKHLPDYHEVTQKLDIVGLILFGSGVALFSYVLEVFGEHSLSTIEIVSLFALSFALIGGYLLHARSIKHPLLRLNLFRFRTLRIAVGGNFITRLGVGGMPFLLPLLYQIGLGLSPLNSGLLIMPQSLAALGLKMAMPKILSRFGYRQVLLSNTFGLGAIIASFATIGMGTPIWLIIVQACMFGFLSSLQYTSMNTLVYAEVPNPDTSMASTIVSTAQQMALSFGVATASLVTAYFIPGSLTADPEELIHGLHRAFIFLGLTTAVSAFVFYNLKANDGENMSRHKGGLRPI